MIVKLDFILTDKKTKFLTIKMPEFDNYPYKTRLLKK